MSKAENIAKASTKGSFHLLWGLVISTLIQAIGTIFISRLLGSDAYGLYLIALTAPTLIATFRDWGINTAMIRCTAQCRSEGKENEIRSFYISGLIFEIALGLILTVISMALAGFAATVAFNRPNLTPLIEIASFTILAGGLMNAATAAFTGLERMELNSVMIVFQAIVKTALMIGLVALGLGTAGATIGLTIGFGAAGGIGLFLLWTVYRKLPKPENGNPKFTAQIKSMFNYGLPLSLAAIVGSFQAQFFALLLPIYYLTDNSIIGNYGIAANFIVLIAFVSTPITTMLFPAFSKLNPQKDKETLQNVFQASVRYASILVVPTAALVICLSQPAVQTVFGETYGTAALFLALLAIGYLYTAFGNLSAGNVINSQGETKYNLKLTALTAIIAVPMGLVLILQFGVVGLIVTSLISGLPSLFISLRWIKNKYELTVNWRASGKILATSLTVSAATYALISVVSFPAWMKLLLGLVVFLVLYLLVAVVTRTIVRADITNLRNMASGLGPVSKVVNALLGIIEKLMTTLGQ
jgi:O-antigen/teichoic acid export membrane protein